MTQLYLWPRYSGGKWRKGLYCFCYVLSDSLAIFVTLKWVKVAQLGLTLRPHGLYSPWNSPGQNTGVGSLSLFQGVFPTQGSNPDLPHCGQIFTSWTTRETQVSHTAGGSLPAEPQGKPKNTGVGSLPLLQQIFLTQELNWSLLHCRWILYQLSYQGSSLKIHWWGIINKICHWWIWML